MRKRLNKKNIKMISKRRRKLKFGHSEIVTIPDNVTVTQTFNQGIRCIFLRGPEFTIRMLSKDDSPERTTYTKSTGRLEIHAKTLRSFEKLQRDLRNNLRGVSQGHCIRMHLKGTGYHAYLEDDKLMLHLSDGEHVHASYDPDQLHVEILDSMIIIRGPQLYFVDKFASALRTYCPEDSSSRGGIFYDCFYECLPDESSWEYFRYGGH